MKNSMLVAIILGISFDLWAVQPPDAHTIYEPAIEKVEPISRSVSVRSPVIRTKASSKFRSVTHSLPQTRKQETTRNVVLSTTAVLAVGVIGWFFAGVIADAVFGAFITYPFR